MDREELITEFVKKFGYHVKSGRAKTTSETHDIINWWLDKLDAYKAEIEHCAEPDCPECNLAAYNRGKADLRSHLVERIEGMKLSKAHPDGAEVMIYDEWYKALSAVQSLINSEEKK